MRYEIKSPSFREGEPSVVVRMIVIPDERVAFSKGGLAQHAKAVAAAGRYGDDMLVHMNKDEFELLKQMWGEPTYHPETGMPEYFSLKSLIPIIGAALMFTGVGSGLGATLLGSGASSMAAGALGNGIIGGLTSAASGGNGSDVLRGALLGGAGGALSGYMSGAGAAKTAGDTAGALKEAEAAQAAASSTSSGLSNAALSSSTPAAGYGSQLGLKAGETLGAAPATDTIGSMAFNSYAPMNTAAATAAAAPTAVGALSSVAPAAAGASQSTGILSKLLGNVGGGAAGAGAAGSGTNGLLQAGMSYAKQHPYISAMLASQLFGPMDASSQEQGGAQAQNNDPNFSMHLPQLQFNRTRNSASGPVTYTYGEHANNQPFYLDNSLAALVPQAPPVPGLASGGEVSVDRWLSDWPTTGQFLQDHGYVITRAGIRSLKQDQNGGTLVPDSLTFDANGKAIPASQAQNMVTIPQPTYTPTTPVVSGTPQNQGGASQSLPPQLGNDYNTNQYDIPVPGSVFKSRYGNYKLPGLAHGGSAVAGPGTGRTDEIPARLSDGEFVIDAETVAMLGDGSTKAGAARLDQMRANLRKHKGKALARGQISPNAKSPEQYMQGNG